MDCYLCAVENVEYSPTDCFPLCGVAFETVDHILRYSEVAPLRVNCYEKLSKWLDVSHTPLRLQLVIPYEFHLALIDPTGPQYQLDSVSPG